MWRAANIPRPSRSASSASPSLANSFTANINNRVRWPDLLEDHLNASAEWRDRVGGKITRVINFGVDGFGLVQFAAIARHYVPEFEPDLVIVNYLSADVLRRMRYMKLPASGSATEDIHTYVRVNFLDPIDWLSWRSEVVAATVGQRWGMVSQMPLDARVLLAAWTDRRVRKAPRRAQCGAGVGREYPRSVPQGTLPAHARRL